MRPRNASETTSLSLFGSSPDWAPKIREWRGEDTNAEVISKRIFELVPTFEMRTGIRELSPMEWIRLHFPLGWALSALVVLVLGCGPSGPAPSQRSGTRAGSDSAASGGELAPVSVAEAQRLVGEYMPPLEGGALLIATPKGWDFGRAGSEYLVGFHPANASLNDLPRILISAEDSAYAGIDDLNSSNARDFVQTLTDALGDEPQRLPATAVTIGDRTWVEHVALRKSRNALVARQILETVVDGRLYKIHLEVFDREFARYRTTAYAVAASAEFEQDSSEPKATPETSSVEPAVEKESTDASDQDAEE